MRIVNGLIVASLVLIAASCAQNRKPVQSEAAMAAQASKVEEADEPAINARTRIAAGQLAESQGNLAAAIKQYEEALKLDPKSEPALYRLGLAQVQAKQFPESIETWKRYVKATDGSAGAYSNLGFCYEVSGDRTAAEQAYQKGIAKDPKHDACRVNYGLMLARAGRTADAVVQLQTVLKPAEVAYNLASVYEQQGRTDLAKEQYRKALEIDPSFKDAKDRLAKLP